MTEAQQNFKKAIAYRKKYNCTLKEAFAAVKKTPTKKVGATKFVEQKESKNTAPAKIYKVARRGNGTFAKFTRIGQLFDLETIKDLDSLKKQYYKLSKKYHPDAGGTTAQFQDLQKEYEKLFNKILQGGKLTENEKQNEVIIDKAIRDIIDNIITLEGITIEVIGKWLWIGGNTYPIRATLKSVGLTFIKKNGIPFWVYKGVESSGRGNMSLDEIKTKYGTHTFDLKPPKTLKGFTRINKTKLKNSLLKIKKGLDKRYI